MKDILNGLSENWDLVLFIIAIIELFVRLLPTRKNYSLIDFIRKIMNEIHDTFNKILPNIKKDV
jgi:hypothetical protein